MTTATTSMMTRMALRVSTYPSKRLSRTMGYGVQGRVRNEIATRERPPIDSLRKKLGEFNAMSKGKQLNGQIKGDQDILTREQVLQILSEQARKGSITAAVHLERALRLGGGEDDDEEDPLADLDEFRPRRRGDRPRSRPIGAGR